MGKKSAIKKGKSIKLKVTVIGSPEDSEGLKELFMCGIFDQLRLQMSAPKAMIVAEAIANDIITDLNIPTAEAMEPETMKRLKEELDAQAQAKADIAQMGEESRAEWLMQAISDVLLESMPASLVVEFTERIGNKIFRDNGTGKPVLNFDKEAGEPDVLQEMRDELGETAEPRPTENADELPETGGLEFTLNPTPEQPAEEYPEKDQYPETDDPTQKWSQPVAGTQESEDCCTVTLQDICDQVRSDPGYVKVTIVEGSPRDVGATLLFT